ncbi:hypothetical protein BJV74DRAFT_944493 [Russula compacta]|nr:hypothetical protein BJV74DRAFT_944493 [Russula compacta]
MFYYCGLPSNPDLVYRHGTTPWEEPTGPEAYRVLKELKPVFSHKVLTIWGDLGPKVCSCLDSFRVTWTSVDVVRFAIVGKAPGPPVLWIGVMPQSLSGKDAHTAAVDCKKLLESYQITDIEVEFRESIFTRSAGPKLLKSVSSTNATAGIRGPLTPTLGLRIAAQATSYSEGTGALYISEGHNSDKVYILSARHVVFPPNAGNNELFNHMNVTWRRRKVLLLGPKAFQTLLKSTMVEIGTWQISIGSYEQGLAGLPDDDKEHRPEFEDCLKKEVAAWSEESQRVLGHIAYSPPITVGTGAEQYTEDWALIELDRNKINWDSFKGNVIDLGSYLEDEMHHPQTLDVDGEPCLNVIKNGCTTGVTIGRANGVKSFVREYFPNGRQQTSMEWAIIPYNQRSGAFSAPGDSGAIIVDGKGRIWGLLTGGTGKTEEDIDVTYATPFYWLLQRIKAPSPKPTFTSLRPSTYKLKKGGKK